MRGGFLLSPSLDGALLLFELFSPRRRSNYQRGILTAHRVVLCRKRSPFAGEHRILCDKSLNACL